MTFLKTFRISVTLGKQLSQMMSPWDSTWTLPPFRRLDWRRGCKGEGLKILLAGEWLVRAQRVPSRLCRKELSAEHDWTRQQCFRATPNSATQHHCRTSHPCQRVCTYIVYNIGYKRRVLRERRSHHQQRPQKWTTCSPGRLQCQSGSRSRQVALLPWTVRRV